MYRGKDWLFYRTLIEKAPSNIYNTQYLPFIYHTHSSIKNRSNETRRGEIEWSSVMAKDSR